MDPDFAHSAPDDPKPKTLLLSPAMCSSCLDTRGTSFARARRQELATPLYSLL